MHYHIVTQNIEDLSDYSLRSTLGYLPKHSNQSKTDTSQITSPITKLIQVPTPHWDRVDPHMINNMHNSVPGYLMPHIYRSTVCNNTILTLYAPINHCSPTAKFTYSIMDTSNAPIWCYNERLCIITHESCTCDLCISWALHYIEHILTDTQSLRDAEHDCDTTIIGNLSKE